MLTLQQAYEIKASLIEYLKATFGFREKDVDKAFLQFIKEMFKGPYIALKQPFVKANESDLIPLDIKPDFYPFYHQLEAFKRLTTKDGNIPKPTILTTGTSSGKTEAFLFPVLDYCYKNIGNLGIKVIILYPMNALATDQAKRIADTIYKDVRLKDNIRVGLFIGEGQDKNKTYPRSMGISNIIENRDEILNSPPDILLTNFKMLDFALMQSRFNKLWKHNFAKPELLKFIVLDELHTYEGAQGSDVANLIRRLKLKLEIPFDYLCPIGTSATIGKGDESKVLLAEFATKIFGEDVSEDAIIEEYRILLDEYFAGVDQRNFLPTIHMLKGSRLESGKSFDDYVKKQLVVWGMDPDIDPAELSEELKKYQIVKDLVGICSNGIVNVDDLILNLSRINKEFAALSNNALLEYDPPKIAVVKSILSLISYAKTGTIQKKFPFLYLQIQIWIRELSGFVRVVDSVPKFKWREEINTKDGEKAFPTYFCRECGASGWFAVKHENKERFENDINDVYKKFFSHNKNLYLVSPYKETNLCIEEYEPCDIIDGYLNPITLSIHGSVKPNTFRIIAYRKLNGNYNLHICPSCNSRNTINIVGQRVATLTSVATSQLISSDLDPTPERKRKLIAFTNGVQDAAHQAGYLEARNYRFTLRTAIQTVINKLKKPVNLSELQEEFIKYWSTNADEHGEKNLQAYYYRFFPNDHASDVPIDLYKIKGSEFFNEFNNRIRWEISSEFGYNSIIGRTLEKTGSSATFFDPQKINDVVPLMNAWFKDNAIEMTTDDDFKKFLVVFLNRLRIRGGLDHCYLNKFRTEKSNYYLLTQNTNKNYFFMRNFGRNTRLPKFITDIPNRYGVFDLTNSTTILNWFHNYFVKCFPYLPSNRDFVNEFYSKMLDVLALPGIGLLDCKMAATIRNFALLPEALYVSKGVKRFECEVCGNKLTTTNNNIPFLQDAKCIVHKCTGRYKESDILLTENYYRQVYNRGRSPRIYAADHTGILDRTVRERLEMDFKESPNFNSKNVLVATSTLEMGINIGDLNSVVCTSVPPSPANYLQRIGRAGRASGSAIVATFVPNEAHDLFYFETPMEMMDGVINTPGCYLEAKEIIRRHFFAYCIDSWTKDDPGNNIIPALIRLLGIEKQSIENPNFFLNKIIGFIKTNQNRLFNNYKSAFREKVSDEIFNELANQIQSQHFFEILNQSFVNLKAEIVHLKSLLKEINQFVQLNNLSNTDPEYKELQRDFRNISATIMQLRKQSVIEYMINDGLLPNYAFPETGVKLKAQISKKNEQNRYDVKSLEVVRAAKSALKELCPDNTFYTQGYKLQVTGVNIVSWKEEAIDYRFCSNCDYVEIDVEAATTNCPKCGNDSWKSPRNIHKMVRLKSVNSFVEEKNAKIDDSSEERERKIARMSQHFKFNTIALQGAWVMKKIPFGIEYNKDVEIVEINMGLFNNDLPLNNDIIINGQEVPKPGYIICKTCGKATSASLKADTHEPLPIEAFHYGFCKNKNMMYNNSADDCFEEVFFYRQMNTEALKILLPVQEFNTESSIKLFKAGIASGLKKYFKGTPDHLEISEYREFNQQSLRNDRFLVIYDTIPGGTGYLSKLFDRGEFNLILKEAYINIRDCTCKLEGKDGCYNCIFTYGNQFEREELSRQRAEELFERIVKSSGDWDYSPNGLGKVANSGKIEESELEEKFIKMLADYYNNINRTSSLNPITEDGITKYLLKIQNNKEELLYEIKPQVKLGPDDGVRYTTITDFMIRLLSVTNDGVEQSNVLTKYKPIAIYLDGYQYHATEENNRFANDLEKRNSILDSNKYWVWNLTWNDLTLFDDPLSETPKNQNDLLKEKLDSEVPLNIKQLIKSHPYLIKYKSLIYDSKNNFQRFIWLLENYCDPNFQIKIQTFTFLFQVDYPNNCVTIETAKKFIQEKSNNIEKSKFGKYNDGYLYLNAFGYDSFYEFRILQKLMNTEYLGRLFVEQSDKGYNKSSWELFWCIYNIFQFGYDKIQLKQKADTENILDTTIDQLSIILENFDESYHELVAKLYNKGFKINIDNYFCLKDERERILAESFLGIYEYNIVIDPLDESSENEFIKAGYKVYKLENFDVNSIGA